MSRAIFHLAFPVTDLAATKKFYVDGLGCRLGRETDSAVILELAGNQIVAHLIEEPAPKQKVASKNRKKSQQSDSFNPFAALFGN